MSPEELLDRFAAETQEAVPWLGGLLGTLLGVDGQMNVLELMARLPALMSHLATPSDQAELLHELARAYARAAGLQLQEVP